MRNGIGFITKMNEITFLITMLRLIFLTLAIGLSLSVVLGWVVFIAKAIAKEKHQVDYTLIYGLTGFVWAMYTILSGL